MQTIAGDIPVQYDAETHIYRLGYEWWHDQSLTTAIVMAVAAITNTPPTEVEPIYRAVNPDSLNDLYAPVPDARVEREGSHTTFTIHDCTVTVHGDGDVEVRPPDDERESRPEPFTGA